MPSSATKWHWLTPAVVWACWLGMLAGLLQSVITYSRQFPLSDETYYLSSPLTASWLWAQHAEHRIPLAKLMWRGVLHLTDWNFRAGNVISVVMVAAVAAALIVAAARIRGRTTITDAFLPLAVLNFGQSLNFLWWWQINHILAPVFATCVLLTIALHGKRLSFRHSFLIALGLCLLALSGPGGLPYVIAVAPWLAYHCVLQVRSSTGLRFPKARAALCMAMTLSAVALVALYFADYSNVEGTSAGLVTGTPDLVSTVGTAIATLSISLGPAVREHWIYAGSGVLLVVLYTWFVLVRHWWDRPDERLRVAGFAAFLAAMCTLFVVLGASRGALGPDYVTQGHYTTLAVPVLCLSYFVMLLYRKRASGSFVRIALLIGTVCLLPENKSQGEWTGMAMMNGESAFIRDIGSGIPAFVLAARHAQFLRPSAPDLREAGIEELLQEMKDVGLPPISQLASSADYSEIEIPLRARKASNARSLEFAIGAAQHVYAVRLDAEFDRSPARWVTVKGYWSGLPPGRQLPGASGTDSITLDTGPEDMWAHRFGRTKKKVIALWVNDVIDHFRIQLDVMPAGFSVTSVVLLVPEK